MRHLALLYTNNKVSSLVLDKVISCFNEMINQPSLSFTTKAIIVSVDPINFDLSGNIKNIIAPISIQNKRHLSIIEKITLAMSDYPSDYVSLHEHDVLYPSNYLISIQNSINTFPLNFDYIAYNNLIGVNETGYLARVVKDYPMSTLTFKSESLKKLLLQKRVEYKANINWCFLEPGYGGSYGKEFDGYELEDGVYSPAIHINMDRTTNNHHLTDHFLTYERHSKTGFDSWPGDLSHLFK